MQGWLLAAITLRESPFATIATAGELETAKVEVTCTATPTSEPTLFLSLRS